MVPPLPPKLLARLARIAPEEIGRQYQLVSGGVGFRAVMTGLVYAIAAVLIPPGWVVLCAIVDFGSERIGLRWMKGLKPAATPWRYLGTIAAGMVSQLAFTTALALSFQSAAPLAQPFAAGVLTLTMLQMASVRVIHQPYATSGLGVAFAVAVAAVLYDWPSRSGPAGLALSLLALAAAAYFIAEIVKDNHALHAGIAHERATARMADQAKSRFLAQISHELRTPLNAILGLGHAELAEATSPQSQERLRLVTDAARGLAVILDDILDLSAMEAGHLPIRPGPCDPGAEITSTAALYRPLYLAQGLEVAVHLDPDLPPRALMDVQRLRQCLSNLFSNALKHMSEGGVTLSAKVTPDGLLSITFCDTGRGIPAEEAERVFQPFQRGSGDQPGMGLGLSITRALARSMGGDLHLLPGENGAQFLLTLAMQKAPPEVTDNLSPPDPQARPRSLALRVLVVDDIATNRLVAKAHLHLYGVITEEAASGREAVAKLQADPPDLVLLDMNMPDMDGIATLRRIRTLPNRAARVPVIAMTADATEAHRRKYLDAGLDGYLAKPLTPEAVSDILSRFRPAAL